jgi:hypothetical protein
MDLVAQTTEKPLFFDPGQLAKNWSFYDENRHQIVLEPGSQEIFIGSSSEDIRLQDKILIVRK